MKRSKRTVGQEAGNLELQRKYEKTIVHIENGISGQ
jgi:hypothetical protein